MSETNITDRELAQSILTGQPIEESSPENPETQEPEEQKPEEPEKAPVETKNEEPEKPEQSAEEPEKEPESQPEKQEEAQPEKTFSIEDVKDEQFIELVNKKFNTKFDTIDAANEYFEKQVSYRGQEKIIDQLVAKVKENNNVLSRYGSESAYKIAKLAEEYPDMETTLSKIVKSDVNTLNDFEAIRLQEELKRGPKSKVDPLRYRMSELGLRDLNIADFEDWDEMDKELIIGKAEDARKELATLQGKIQVPGEEESQKLDFLEEYERGVQSEKERVTKLAEQNTPVAESLVNNLKKIPFGENGDFEFEVNLDGDSKKDLVDFLVSESIEGQYDINKDADVKNLGKMLVQEIWATDGEKIAKAYAEYMMEKREEEVAARYENRAPLNDEQPTPPEESGVETDSVRAQRLLNGNW